MVFSLLPGIVAGYFLLVGILIWKKATPHRARMALLGLCTTTVAWQMIWAILFQVTDADLANFLIKFGYLLIIFLPTTLYHFLAEISVSHRERRYVYLSYGVAAILAVTLLSSDLFVDGYYVYSWGYYPKAGMLHPLHVLQTMVVVVRGLLIAYQKQKTTFDPLKTQLRYCVASLLIYLFAAVDYLCNYGFEFYPPGILFITASLTLITYAIAKKELLDIRIVVSQVTAYSIISVLAALSFVIVNMLPGHNGSATLLLNIAIALAWGKYGGKLREKLQTSSERKWVSNWYKPDEVVNDLTRRLQHLLDRDSIVMTIAETLSDVMGARQTHALIRDQAGYRSYTNSQDTTQTVPPGYPLIDWLINHPVRVIPFAELPPEIKLGNSLDFSPGSFILSLYSSQHLEGVLVLGERDPASGYKLKDRQLFETIVRQVEVFLDRSEMHQKLLEEAEALHREKLLLSKAVAGTIAHELRTPLTTISMTAKSFGKYLPLLWTGYELGIQNVQGTATQASFDIPLHRRDILKSSADDISEAVRRAQTMITLLLANVRSDAIDENSFHCYSMKTCVEKALTDYPFRAGDKNRVHFDDEHDFDFVGLDTLLVYVIYNLINNALYYIAKAGKGEISIWMERGQKFNLLHFKDTGSGVPEAVLPRIFEHFFTTKPKDIGNGLGLSFCRRVVNSFNGQIKCYSMEGEFTEFHILLPQVMNDR